jgi:hypothetical protein
MPPRQFSLVVLKMGISQVARITSINHQHLAMQDFDLTTGSMF